MSCKEKNTKKYRNRPSPPFSAQDCKGLTKKGKDGTYVSKADKRGIYKWIKVSMTLKKKGKSYDIHDNGERPFRVTIDKETVSIYKCASDKLIKTVKAKKVYIGKGNGKSELGNTILLHIFGKKHMYIGQEIYEFDMDDKDKYVYAHWFISLGDHVVGYIGIRPTKLKPGAVQYRIFIDPSFQGQGIAYDALSQVIGLLGDKTILANIEKTNTASIKLAEKAGLTKSDMRSEYGFKYGVWIKATQEFDKTALDTFPYRKYFISDVHTMWDNLSIDKIEVIKTDSGIAVHRTFPEEFNSCDSISDHFAEKQRIMCFEKGQPSPAMIWSKMKIEKHNWRSDVDECKRYRELVYSKSRGCNLFNAALALSIYDRYKPASGEYKILDPAAGWGDRLLAAMKLDATYIGFDTNPNLQSVYDNEIEFACTYSKCKHSRVVCGPYESTDIPETEFDTILVSPPFFDQEIYEGDKTSTNLYKTYQRWIDSYYIPMINKSHKLLKVGGHMIFYIPPRLVDKTMEIANTLFTYVEKIEFVQVTGDKPRIRESFVFKKTEAQSVTFSTDSKFGSGEDKGNDRGNDDDNKRSGDRGRVETSSTK
jgi:tRNA1(Val) A37 N6-methylase TrmN6/GNAT superfamily N-acetyltransferase